MKDFEHKLIELYPSLFPQSENGTALPSQCGIGGQREWYPIIQALCKSLAHYKKFTTQSKLTSSKTILFYNFLFKLIWMPIHRLLMLATRPDNDTWVVVNSKEWEKIQKSLRGKFRQSLISLTYNRLKPKNLYTTHLACENLQIAQIKSKFGSIRIYVDGADSTVRGMILFAESLCNAASEKIKNKK